MGGARVRGAWLPAAALAALGCSGSTAPRDGVAGEPMLVVALRVAGNQDVFSLRADGSALTRLTTDAADDDRPTASGNTVVFTSARDGGSTLYAVSPTGGADRRLASSGVQDLDPALSPDGRRLAFTRASAGGAPRLTVSRPDGSGAAAVAEAGRDAAAVDAGPAWRPDGGAIAWVTSASGSADIVVAAPGSGAWPATVAGGPFADVEPAWRPDGGALAFVSSRDGDQAVFVLVPPSTVARRLSPVGVAASSPTWISTDEIVYVARDATTTTLRRQRADGGAPAVVIPLPLDAVPSHPRAAQTP